MIRVACGRSIAALALHEMILALDDAGFLRRHAGIGCCHKGPGPLDVLHAEQEEHVVGGRLFPARGAQGLIRPRGPTLR